MIMVALRVSRSRYQTRPLWVIGLLLWAGCSRPMRDKWRDELPPTHPAGGRVVYNGKPLEDATVVFITKTPGSNRTIASTGCTDAAGRFMLRTNISSNGAIAGQHQVMITKTIMVSPTDQPLVANQQGEFLESLIEKSLIPEKYRSPTDSGLSATVLAGQRNDFEFLLSGP